MRARIVALVALLGAFSPAVMLDELLGDNFLISFQQGIGNVSFEARNPAVAYNPNDHEYLVVWAGQFQEPFLDCGFNPPTEREIHRQRIDAASGALIESAGIVSRSGPACNNQHQAFRPAVAYNATHEQYLVVWHGDDDGPGMADDEFEIFGRRLDADGTPLGDDFRISTMGGTGDASFDALTPAVVWNALNKHYLVVWSGDDGTGDLEIYGQLIDADGGEIGADDFRISDMGFDGLPSFSATNPAAAWNATSNRYLVVWEGSDLFPGAGELEIFGQRLATDGDEIGRNDFRISFQQGSGDPNFRAKLPDLAYNADAHEYLVVWQGEFRRPEPTCAGNGAKEQEIFAQRIDAGSGELVGSADAVSASGSDCDNTHMAFEPAVSYNATAGEHWVVWHGDDQTGGLANDEFEIFGRRLNQSGVATEPDDFRISQMGGTGNPAFDAVVPDVASAADDGVLVVWYGDDNVGGLVDNELEIFGRLGGSGTIFADGFE